MHWWHRDPGLSPSQLAVALGSQAVSGIVHAADCRERSLPSSRTVRHHLFIQGDVLLARMIAGRAYQETTPPGHRQGQCHPVQAGPDRCYMVRVSKYFKINLLISEYIQNNPNIYHTIRLS